MDEKSRNGASDGAGRLLHWWHLGALLLLVGAVEGGRSVLAGAGIQGVLPSLPHSLYNWCPIIGGVAISIRRADRHSSRAALSVGIVVTALMVGLDLLGSSTRPPEAFTTALTEEGRAIRGTVDTGTSATLTGLAWLRGDLTGVENRLDPGVLTYPSSHPRLRAAEALQDGSLVLLVFGILGLVIAAGRWIRHQVTFRRREDERGAHLVVAWLLSPLAFGITASATDRLFHTALFRDGSLLTIPLPPLGLLAIGVYLWIRAVRPPPPDEPAETVEP